MLLGRSVLVYANGEGFTNPSPGTVTGVYPEDGSLIDVNVQFRKSSPTPNVVALERVKLCETVEEARKAQSSGVKFIACQYDPAEPEGFEVEAEIPVKKVAKPKK